MKQTDQINIDDYLEVALRRKWLIILPFLLTAILSIAYSFLSPNIYRAGTLIIVQTQKVPEAYVRSTVTSGIEDRLRTITQQIMSRTILEKVIKELNLFVKEKESLTMEEIVEVMRKKVDLKVKRRDSFELFYQGKDPKVVAMVANKLAALFIDENLKVREQQAEGTTEFLENELLRIKNKLESSEKAIRTFKQKHMGELPEQLDSNLRVLDRFQLQLQTNVEVQRGIEDRKILIQKQHSEIEPKIINLEDGNVASVLPSGSQLVMLKQELLNLKTRYTDKHPDVIKIEEQIRNLEKELSGGKGSESTSSMKISSSNPLYPELAKQLNEINLEIRRLKVEEKRLRNQIKAYQMRVENTPKCDQEMAALTRDYWNIQQSYQSLLQKRLEAQLSANMERRQKGEQFKILDIARIPEKPFKPKRLKIILLGLALGLGFGGGLCFSAEYLDPYFRSAENLEEFTKLPVLSSIPKISTDIDLMRERIKKRLILISTLGTLVVIIATVIVHFFVFKLDFLVMR
jgi:polysaccharide chain length determinant protein (PEP-CTERM system associated)